MVKWKATYYLSLWAALVLCACQGEGSSKKGDALGDIDFEVKVTKETNGNKKIYYRFPSPDEIINYINTGNLTYQQNILNPVNRRDEYFNSHSQSLSLGIYISDLAYITLFNKLKDAQQYLQAVEELSSKVRINNAFDENMKQRVRSNLHNVDSLVAISRDSYNDMVRHLENTNNDVTLALVSSGAYVEAMYLVLNHVQDYQIGHP
ncbi:MAG: hypothetical protein HC896_03185 [Bacteroidales bacterium]|nr:hypothetical protein [Bacteroidales bacterium]